MTVSRAAIALTAIAAVIGVAGCAGSDADTRVEAGVNADAPDASVRSGMKPATSAAVAAGLLNHVNEADVVRIAASDAGGVLQASVSLDGPGLEAAHVSISSWESGLSRCGLDSGYERVSCFEGREFTEVVTRKLPKPHLPVFIGRAQSNYRGSVLVQVFGKRSPSAQELVDSIVGDPLLGMTTSSELIAEGDALSDVEDLNVGVHGN